MWLENLAGSLHFNGAQLLPFLPLDSLSPAVAASSLPWLCSLCIEDQVESGSTVIYIKDLMLVFRQNIMEFLPPEFQIFIFENSVVYCGDSNNVKPKIY